MAYGKTIEMFLVDGTADGVVTAELSNWNGKAIRLPRTEVSECQRTDIQGVGVYFLFSKADDGTDAVYVGEAENILKRLKQHLADFQSGKESYYWTTAVAFVGRDLNKALIRYLENRLVEEVKACGRERALTKATYSTVLKESEIASMEEFIDNIKVLISALGHKTLTPVPKATDSTTYLYCKSGSADGKGFVTASGFTVAAGSVVSDHVVPSMKTRGKSYFELRARLEEDGVIAGRVFQRDYEFSAPSAASAVILGRTSNGNADWKTASGVKLGSL